jgi:integrase
MVEHAAVNRVVVGSSPTFGANLSADNQSVTHVSEICPKDSPNNSAFPAEKTAEDGVEGRTVKFPVKLKYRGRVLATIYAKTPAHPVYRLYWRVDRKSRTREFPKYADAKREGDKLVTDLAKGSQVTALSSKQASDAIAAFQRLDRYFQATGRRVSLLEGISEYCESAAKLSGQAIGEAIDRYLATVAVVRRKPLAEAVAEFILARKPLSESEDGKRSKHSPVYESHVAAWLGDFSGTFPGYAVCDLNKEHLNTYIAKFEGLSGKSRNDRRGTAKMFLRWATQKDYLPQNHRLFEAVGFKTEDGDATEIDFYRPKELRDMLNGADEALLPVIALGGLAGLRREEIMRLEWADVWRVEGKVEISARIAKGRKRRLVDICPALAEWLQSYRKATGLVWTSSASGLEAALRAVREATKIPSRRNGLRHAFITFHFAMHTNENLTAAEAGNSPQMLHQHYRALATRAEAEKWFAVKPSKSAKNVIRLDSAANA